jgi:protein-tyrosine kinase
LGRKKSNAEQMQSKKNLITYSHPESYISDQFRNIRSYIDFAGEGQKFRSLVISSPGFNEGKTTTAINLAVSLAQRGDKVLLIDADIRKPMIHSSFNIKNVPGLTNVLAGQLPWREAVHRTEIGRLEVLTSGPILYNSAEMLGSQLMAEFMETAGKHYDIILLDVPPVLEASDTKILSSRCDGLILVIRNGKTKNEAAVEAKQLLEMAKAKVIGVVVNEG